MRVVELRSYPVKGCAGARHTSATFGSTGIVGDRTFMVTGPDGVFRSQRRDPRLALVTPELDELHTVLRLSAPGVAPFALDVDADGPRVEVEMHGNPYVGADQGDAVAEWFSTVVGASCRLVRVPPEHRRMTGGLVPGTAAFADSAAVHLLSTATLDELNRRLDGHVLGVERFRPNILVEGALEPSAEDTLRRLRVGGVELAFTKLTKRCAVTRVDQRRGAPDGPEPLRTLAAYRRYDGGVAFGVQMAVTRPGHVHLGDELDVREWGPSLVPGPAISRA